MAPPEHLNTWAHILGLLFFFLRLCGLPHAALLGSFLRKLPSDAFWCYVAWKLELQLDNISCSAYPVTPFQQGSLSTTQLLSLCFHMQHRTSHSSANGSWQMIKQTYYQLELWWKQMQSSILWGALFGFTNTDSSFFLLAIQSANSWHNEASTDSHLLEP